MRSRPEQLRHWARKRQEANLSSQLLFDAAEEIERLRRKVAEYEFGNLDRPAPDGLEICDNGQVRR